jgi:hypothetical protein
LLSVENRVHKVLVDANIKHDIVATRCGVDTALSRSSAPNPAECGG